MHACIFQVPCRGKGQPPDTTAVNKAVYEIWAFLEHYPKKYVFLHCTHGFNRTGWSVGCSPAYIQLLLLSACHDYTSNYRMWPSLGYVIVCALIRLLDTDVDRAIKGFAGGRKPGIYKNGKVQLTPSLLLHLLNG